MKWIKASERLPINPRELVCMRGDGGGCYHYETADRQTLVERLMEDKQIHHKYNPEWLDEFPASTHPEEPEGQDEKKTWTESEVESLVEYLVPGMNSMVLISDFRKLTRKK